MSDHDEISEAIAHNLRALRAQRGLTLDALAARSRVSRGMLIQIEQARTNPSIATIVRISDALGVSVARLIEADPAPRIQVVRAKQAVRLWEGMPGSSGTLLLGTDPPVAEMWEWWIAPGDGYDGEPHHPGTRELLYVLNGELTLTLGTDQVTAATGDMVSFTADAAHRYANDASTPLRFILAISQTGAGSQP